jgi:hypothetical protein
MDLDIYAGKSFLLPHQVNREPHLWVVVTEPSNHLGKVVIVNITTRNAKIRTNYDFSDSTTILKVGDHPFITKESFVYYAYARFSEVNALQAGLSAYKTLKEDFSAEILSKIQMGCVESPHTPEDVSEYIKLLTM